MAWRTPAQLFPPGRIGPCTPVGPTKPGLLREDLQQQEVFHQLFQGSSGLWPTEVYAPETKPSVSPKQLSSLSSRHQACDPAPHCTKPVQPRIPGRLQWGTGGGPRVTMGLQGVDEPLSQRLHVSTSH